MTKKFSFFGTLVLALVFGMVFALVLAGCGGGSVSVEKLAEKLSKLKNNTADKPYTVKMDKTVNISSKGGDINTAVKSEGKYVILDLSDCSAAGNKVPNMSIIRDNTFLVGIVLPKTATTIADDSFDGCSSLTSITIPAALIDGISEDIFDGCEKLATITVEATNTAYSSVDGVLFDKAKTTLVLFPEGKGGSYTIPSSVTSIGYCAFEGCEQLTDIIIPSTVTSIGDSAFAGCSGLSSVTIPDSVTSLGKGVFSGCNGLTSVTLGNGVTEIEAQAFWGYEGLTSVNIGNNVTSIGISAFEASGLTSVTIPEGVTSIGDNAFYGCKLTSVIIPASVTSIDYLAFQSEDSVLTSVTFAGGETQVRDTIISRSVYSVFPYGASLKTAAGDTSGAGYPYTPKAGTYTRSGNTWTKQN